MLTLIRKGVSTAPVLLVGSDEEVSFGAAVLRYEVGRVVARYGLWVVTDYGIECLGLSYPIEAERLDEQDWLERMAEKNWVDAVDFAAAYQHALRYHVVTHSYSEDDSPWLKAA